MPKLKTGAGKKEIELEVGVRGYAECAECSYPINGETLGFRGQVFCRPECAFRWASLDPKTPFTLVYPPAVFDDPYRQRGPSCSGLPYGRPDRFLRKPQPVFSEKGYRSGDRGSDDAGPDAADYGSDGLVLE